jgi:hypothetical protein
MSNYTLTRLTGHSVVFLDNIAEDMSQCIVYDHSSHSLTEFVGTGDTAVLLDILDVPIIYDHSSALMVIIVHIKSY